MASTSTPPSFQAPPKPWETANVNAEAGPSYSSLTTGQSNGTTMTVDRSPDLPERPGEMGMAAGGYNPNMNTSMTGPSSFASRMNPMGSGYGGGGYGSYGGGLSGGMYGGGYGSSSYGSPYSRMGGMGGSYGGGYNSYSPYNNDPYSQPGLPPTFGSQIHNSTAPAFAVLESLVGAFTSLAQLFESTYIATHSSFYAMVGVADQLGGLKTYLAQVLGVFSVLRLGRKIVAFLKGDRTAFRSSSGPLGASGTNWAEEWNWKIGRAAGGPGDQSLHPPSGPTSSKRPSSKPLLLFLLSSIGLPWLMTKLIRLLTRIQEEKRMASIGPGSELAGNQGNAAGGQITFARALWPFEAGAEHELALKRDEIVAILQRHEAGQEQGQGRELGWWRGRTRDGRTGWFPGNYVEVLQRKGQGVQGTGEKKV